MVELPWEEVFAEASEGPEQAGGGDAALCWYHVLGNPGI